MSTSHSDDPAQGAPSLVAPDELPAARFEDWQKAAQKALKGAELARLESQTLEGITRQPLYRREDSAGLPQLGGLPGQPPYVRGARALGHLAAPWTVASELLVGDPSAWNERARLEFEGGAGGLVLQLDQAALLGLDPDASAAAGKVGAEGLSVATRADLARALASLPLHKLQLLIRPGAHALELAALLFASTSARGVSLSALHGELGADPLGTLAQRGSLPRPLERHYDELADLARFCGAQAPGLRPGLVSGLPYREAGADAVQELACALATGAEYLRALCDRGLTPDQAVAAISVELAVGPRLFVEVAKLRALRALWDAVAAAFGAEAGRAPLLRVRTARYSCSRLDPWTNILRQTLAAFGGIVGGAGGVIVEAYDRPLGLPEQGARRLARNTQILLREEAALGRVVDPAGGSDYVEALTDALGRQAWALFQQLEQQGGMAAALASGAVQGLLAAKDQEQRQALARQQQVLVGVNLHPNVFEQRLERPGLAEEQAERERRKAAVASLRGSRDQVAVSGLLQQLAALQGPGGQRVELAAQAAGAGASLSELAMAAAQGLTPCTPIAPLPPRRLAAELEALRQAAAVKLQRQGSLPQAFLAGIGPKAALRPRVEQARSFLEAGGFKVQQMSGLSSAEAAAGAARADGARLVLLCAADEAYPELVPALHQALDAGGARPLLAVAGRPPADAPWSELVDAFIYRGADLLETLGGLQRALEVIP